jgi:hypothetical protein
LDFEETIPYKDACPLDIDIGGYIALERADRLRAFSARRDGRLIGYCIYIVTPGSLHSKSTKRATCTDWFLRPEERRGWRGIALRRYAERKLASESVVIVATAVMESSKAAQAILVRDGYTLTEHIYTKVLNHA